LSHGSRNGTISKSVIEEQNAVFDQLKTLSKSSDPKSDAVVAWAQWELVETEVESVLVGADEAKSRLMHLPLYRKIVYGL
jgi:hypothetical protein